MVSIITVRKALTFFIYKMAGTQTYHLLKKTSFTTAVVSLNLLPWSTETVIDLFATRDGT